MTPACNTRHTYACANARGGGSSTIYSSQCVTYVPPSSSAVIIITAAAYTHIRCIRCICVTYNASLRDARGAGAGILCCPCGGTGMRLLSDSSCASLVLLVSRVAGSF